MADPNTTESFLTLAQFFVCEVFLAPRSLRADSNEELPNNAMV